MEPIALHYALGQITGGMLITILIKNRESTQRSILLLKWALISNMTHILDGIGINPGIYQLFHYLSQ